MATKINATEEVVNEAVVEQPVVEQPVVEQPKIENASELEITEAEIKAYSTPANWNIKASEEDAEYIEAVNYSTNETFEGTIEEFNAFLRG